MGEKKHFIWVSIYLEVESTNWGHYFYVSYWRRGRHITWSSQPRKGPAACSAKGLPSLLSYSLKTLSRVRSRKLNPRPPALQSSALPTQLILRGLILTSPKIDLYLAIPLMLRAPLSMILFFTFWSEAGASAIFLNQVNKDLQKKINIEEGVKNLNYNFCHVFSWTNNIITDFTKFLLSFYSALRKFKDWYKRWYLKKKRRKCNKYTIQFG